MITRRTNTTSSRTQHSLSRVVRISKVCDGVKCTQMPIFGWDNLLHLTKIKYPLRALGSAKHGAEIRHPACEYKRGLAGPRNLPIWRPNEKKPKKARKISGQLHGRFSANKHVYGQIRGAEHTHTMKALDKHSKVGKTRSCCFR